VQRHGLTIRSASGEREKVVLDGQCKFTKMIRVRGAKDLTIADMTMTNSRQYGIFMLGDSDCQRLKVWNMKFHNIWVRAVKGTHGMRVDDNPGKGILTVQQAMQRRPTGGQIRHCLFLNDTIKPFDDDGFDGDYVSGIDMMWLKDWTIADNVFVGIRGRNGRGRGAIFVWVNSEGVVAERNVIVNCDRGICFGNPSGDPLHMTGGIARNNFIVAGNRQGVEFVRTVGSMCYNNTILGTADRFAVLEYNECSWGGKCFNNLVQGKISLNHDCARGNNYNGDLSGSLGRPEIGDLHLTPAGAEKAGAEVLGAGAALPEVTEDFDRHPRRSPPDIGAHQYS